MREELAALMHEIWAGWASSMLGQRCEKGAAGSLVIPRRWVYHWDRQIVASYDDLSEEEKDSDRREADKVLVLLNEKSKKLVAAIEKARYAMIDGNEYDKLVPVAVIDAWLASIEEML